MTDLQRSVDTADATALRAFANELRAQSMPVADAQAMRVQGLASLRSGELAVARQRLEEAVAAFRTLPDIDGEAASLSGLGKVLWSMGDLAAALSTFEMALALHQQRGDNTSVANAIGGIGTVYMSSGDFTRALQHFHRSLAMHEEANDRAGMAALLGNIGVIHQHIGSYPQALEHYHRALALHQDLGNRSGEATTIGNIGNVHLLTGDHTQALEHLHQARARAEELGERSSVARLTGNIGHAMAMAGDQVTALEYFRAMHRLYEEIGSQPGVINALGNIMHTLIELGRHEESERMLVDYDAIDVVEPTAQIARETIRAALHLTRNDLRDAAATLQRALQIAQHHALSAQQADVHRQLRDLALRQQDLEAYVEHNAAFTRITEEINGRQTAQSMATMEAERRMESERRERDKERAVLYSALPKHIAERVVRGERVSGDHFDSAAVLFIDVVEFTSHTSQMHPADVVGLLDEMFNALDAICMDHDAIKIKTIGDSYMCFRGDADAPTNARSVADVAQAALRLHVVWPDGSPVQLRAGAHLGPATAGVIGTQRLQYDVWGDTVNVASRMESTGEPGRIHVSDTFAQHLTADTMTLLPRGVVDVKGKGAMSTYWLEVT